ncbi:EmrA/EmrK family multidrug efflux transporter periplasmic adaptor subunit [Orbus sturtevantii]|uniref:EmrA/EmrK family multidrug efflux transporter periplasmic adaptor subunit n=1 Tax=Orbus sturtevantii TaxID=3074109 RepID=UPI00370D5263
MTSQSTSDPNSIKRRSRWILIASLVFIVVFCLYGLYWFVAIRGEVSTDDAYVSGIQSPVVAQTTGKVIQVSFVNTDLVKAGEILIRLDDTDAKLAYQQATDALANIVRQTQVLYIDAEQYLAKIKSNEINLQQAQQDYQRRLSLGRKDDVSIEELQHAKQSMELAQLDVEIAKQQYQANQALLHGVTLHEQPAVKQAADTVRQAWVTLQRTTIRSPITGYVARSNVEVGSQVTPESQLMVIVPPEPIWIDANFKETQLQDIRIGQTATAISDLYGDNVTYQGKVVGINMGTGSAFSLLPAQNATGNWIKVVQRLPVRIELDKQQVNQYPLRIGLSMNVTIDVRNDDGQVLATTQRTIPFYESNALVLSLDNIDIIINEIIEQNTYSPTMEQ